MPQEHKEYYNELLDKARTTLKLYESKTIGLSVGEMKAAIGEMHTKLIELETENDLLLSMLKELEISYNKYALLYDFSPNSLITIDDRGKIVDANLTFAHYLGLEKRNILNVQLINLIHENDKEAFTSYFQSLKTSPATVSRELKISTKTDTLRIIQIRGVRIQNPADNEVKYFLTVIDINDKEFRE
jgi:PAS domain S-box-containing protein